MDSNKRITLQEPNIVLGHIQAVAALYQVQVNRYTPDEKGKKGTMGIHFRTMAQLHPHVTNYLNTIVRPEADGVGRLREVNALFGEAYFSQQQEQIVQLESKAARIIRERDSRNNPVQAIDSLGAKRDANLDYYFNERNGKELSIWERPLPPG